MIRTDLRKYLLTKTDLTALVGTRIHWQMIPQSERATAAYPCITYRRDIGGHGHDIDGSSGFAAPVFDFFVWGQGTEEVEAAAEQLRLSLQGFTGVMGETQVHGITLDDDRDFYFEPRQGEKVGLWAINHRYKIEHAESIPVFEN